MAAFMPNFRREGGMCAWIFVIEEDPQSVINETKTEIINSKLLIANIVTQKKS